MKLLSIVGDVPLPPQAAWDSTRQDKFLQGENTPDPHSCLFCPMSLQHPQMSQNPSFLDYLALLLPAEVGVLSFCLCFWSFWMHLRVTDTGLAPQEPPESKQNTLASFWVRFVPHNFKP